MSRNNIDTFEHRILAGVVLAPAATQTTEEIFLLGASEKFGCDWDLSSATTISFKIEILQSNEQEGPYVKWSAPSAAGTTRVNQITTAVAQDGSDFNLTPSSFCKVKVTNLGAAALTVNRLTFFVQ